jgi:hypothetical protein
MRHELRCDHKLHGILDSEMVQGSFEVRCDSRLCGKRSRVIVLHTIDLATGEVETQFYKNPPQPRGA